MTAKHDVLCGAVNVGGAKAAKYLIEVLDVPDLPGARCKGVDPEIFFRRPPIARKLCAQCGVRTKCLEAVLAWDRAHPGVYERQQGIVGGTSEEERVKMIREEKRES